MRVTSETYRKFSKVIQSSQKFTQRSRPSKEASGENPLPGVFESKSFVTLFKCKTFYSEVPLLNKKQPRNAIPVISHSRCLLLMRAIWGHFAEDLDDLSLYVLLFVLQMWTGFKCEIELPASPNWTPYWAPFREQFAWRKVGWKVSPGMRLAMIVWMIIWRHYHAGDTAFI